MRGEAHILVYCPIDTLQWGQTHSAMLQELRKDDEILHAQIRSNHGSSGKYLLCSCIKMNISGLKEWGQGSKRIEAVFQEMFPTSSSEDGTLIFSETYRKYKRNYVRHLSFNPENQNLSMVIYID